MGQKVHPTGLRLGFIKDWSSQWFAKTKDFPSLIGEDFRIRNYIKKNFAAASISKVDVTQLRKVEGIGKKTAEKILKSAKELLEKKVHEVREVKRKEKKRNEEKLQEKKKE